MKKIIFVICFLLVVSCFCFAEGAEEKAWVEYPTDEFGDYTPGVANVYYGNFVKKSGSTSTDTGYYFRITLRFLGDGYYCWTYAFKDAFYDWGDKISKIEFIYDGKTAFTYNNPVDINNNFMDPEYLIEDTYLFSKYFMENAKSVITEEKSLLKVRITLSNGDIYGAVINNVFALCDWVEIVAQM